MSVFLRKQGDIAIGCIRRTGRPEESRRRKGSKCSPLCYQITMSAEECERSELAMDAIHRL